MHKNMGVTRFPQKRQEPKPEHVKCCQARGKQGDVVHPAEDRIGCLKKVNLGKDSILVLMDAQGIQLSSEDFAQKINEWDQGPKSRIDILQEQLEKAIRDEDYETAARIRDELKKMLESS